MKTFEQFLIEAGSGQGKKARWRDAFGPTNQPQRMSAHRTARIAKQVANQPRGGSNWHEADIERQLRQQRTPQPPTSTTPAKPKIELGLTKLSSTKPKYIIDIRGLSRRAREKAGVVIKGKTGKPLTGAARKSRIRSARTFSRKPV